jgi:hypothetical protein
MRFAPLLAVAWFALASSAACARAPAETLGSDHSADTGNLGFCRTTTCASPADYPHDDGTCEPADWSDSDTCHAKNASNAPLWWSTSCVGFDVNEAASKLVPYETARDVVTAAFGAWTLATCPAGGDSSRPSIDVRDLGPVSCATATYDTVGPNQNVVVFHDDAWPYEAANRAATGTAKSLDIALTTVTYDPESGQIYDADVELNTADYAIVQMAAGDAAPTDGETFDLQSVLTHELGHFLGLAHSPLPDAVMNASGDTDTGSFKRALRLEDVRGICDVYPADGTRAVSMLVAPSGSVAEGACDPTPRHGFSATCL